MGENPHTKAIEFLRTHPSSTENDAIAFAKEQFAGEPLTVAKFLSSWLKLRQHLTKSDDDGAAPDHDGQACMRVLVIDDCVDAAFLLSELLKRSGYEAQWADNSRAALEIAATWRPDAVFVDIALPNEDGYALARRLRSEAGLHEALIVALSGYADDVSKRLASGIDAHLLKPASVQALRDVMETEEHSNGAYVAEYRRPR
jgi:CheY-like chemotaxis protein